VPFAVARNNKKKSPQQRCSVFRREIDDLYDLQYPKTIHRPQGSSFAHRQREPTNRPYRNDTFCHNIIWNNYC
jgi:hypothetical protein